MRIQEVTPAAAADVRELRSTEFVARNAATTHRVEVTADGIRAVPLGPVAA